MGGVGGGGVRLCFVGSLVDLHAHPLRTDARLRRTPATRTSNYLQISYPRFISAWLANYEGHEAWATVTPAWLQGDETGFSHGWSSFFT
ncbi:hypothetical protein VULLAG_LOCUS23481 [Vulpes lagopus]